MDFAHYQSPIIHKHCVSGTNLWRLSDIRAKSGTVDKKKNPRSFGIFPTYDSIRRTPLLNGHLELLPAFLYSLCLTLYKTHTSKKRTPRVGPCRFLYSLYLTVYKTHTSVKRTPGAGPCLSLLALFDSLQDGHLC